MQKRLIICINRRLNPSQPSCAGRGSELLAERLEAELKQRGLPIELERVYCLGECEQGPNMRLAPGGPVFHGVSEESLDEILEAASAFNRQDGG